MSDWVIGHLGDCREERFGSAARLIARSRGRRQIDLIVPLGSSV